MPKTKRYLPFPLFLLSLAIVSLGVYYTIKTYAPTPEPLTINQLTTTGSVSLSLTPATVTVNTNTDTTISVMINSGTDRLRFVVFEITYDTSKLTVSAPTLGTWITKELAPITVSGGKITGQLGAVPDPDPTLVPFGGPELYRTGSGTLFTFKVKGTTPGTYPISFKNTPSSAWTSAPDGVDRGTNQLRTTSGTSVVITVVNVAPAITTQPLSQTVTPGQTATFSVSATGTPTPTYQWKKGSDNITGATSATLTLSNVQTSHAGSYSVVVTNSLGSVTSSAANLSVKLLTDLVGTDHKVDKYDYVELVNQFGKTPAGTADFNNSGAVDGADYSRFLSDYGKTW